MANDIRALQSASRLKDEQFDELKCELARLETIAFADAARAGLGPERSISTIAEALRFYRLLSLYEYTLPRFALVREHLLVSRLTRNELREIIKRSRKEGYWQLTADAQRELASRTNDASDIYELEKTNSILSVFSAPLKTLPMGHGKVAASRGPVIHVVGNSPFTAQVGYTFRTAYTVQAQLKIGIPALVAVQPGAGGKRVKRLKRAVYQGVEYVSLPGEPRDRYILTEWFEHYIETLESLVLEEKPSILHAHSDFYNGAAAIIVGRRNTVPVVYESRGFWEESWLSRLGDRLDLGLSPAQALEPFGLPEAYSLRKRAEESVRTNADGIITLASVMKDHIVNSPKSEDLPPVHIVPNAVNADQFVPRPKDRNLLTDLGIACEAVVIGYVTSMTEYEGIGILIKAFAHLRKASSTSQLHLLLVGDGPVLSSLKSTARALGLEESVTFTGKVSHSQVGAYYSLIDIFVVPRRSTPVSELVTPLKPFEAMAMGKAVVMSGVEALREIANESQAALTFIPNDYVDLAKVLEELVSNKSLRQELGVNGRRWVEQYRTWEVNADKIREIYKSFGAEWPNAIESMLESREAFIQQYLRDNPPPLTGWFVLGRPQDSPKTVMEHGWGHEGRQRIRLDQKIEWDEYPTRDRSLAFWLQAWYFVDSFFVAGRHPTLTETRFLLSVVYQWNQHHTTQTQSSDPDQSMAYYDMSLALRVPRLLALIWAADRFEETRSEVDWLIERLLHERQALREDTAFAPHSNHGFFTAAAQLHLERFLPNLIDHEWVYAQGLRRMNKLLASQFASDGGHLEHSPSYHRLLLGSFMSAVNDGIINDERTRQYLDRAQEVLGWMVQPDGKTVSLGDTTPRVLSKGIATSAPSVQWIVSDGEFGEPIDNELLALPESGYVFVRSPQPQKPGTRLDSSYLAFQCGFHSRAHKHADDLSLIWFDRGEEILIDAGQWGYGDLLPAESRLRETGFYYAAPERQYVESVRAHNTVQLDEQAHDRRRKPYGSALVSAEKHEGGFLISGKAPHSGFEHSRRLDFRPRERLNVRDTLSAHDESEHQLSVWFLMNGEFQLVEWSSSEAKFKNLNGEILRLSTTGILQKPIRGQLEPLVGWRSVKEGELVPAWSLNITARFKHTVEIGTSFDFGTDRSPVVG